MRIVAFSLFVILALTSCKKETPPKEPENETGCRLVKTEYYTSSFPETVLTNIIGYDSRGKISYIVNTNGNRDSMVPVYLANTAKLAATDFYVAGEIVHTNYTYNSDNQVTEIANGANRSRMYYKNGKLDSATREFFNTSNGWLAHPTHQFVWGANGSISRYVAINQTEGTDVTFFLTDKKHNLGILADIDPFGELYYSDLFPLGRFGYADKYLLQKLTSVISNRSGTPILYETRTFDYAYTFDEKGNLATSALKVTDQYSSVVINRKYFYECN